MEVVPEQGVGYETTAVRETWKTVICDAEDELEVILNDLADEGWHVWPQMVQVLSGDRVLIVVNKGVV